MKVGDLVRLVPEHYNKYADWLNEEQKVIADKSFGIITDVNPSYYFVKWFNNPLYGNEKYLAHLRNELEVVCEGR